MNIKNKMKQGFSLIEVIVAVAILAVLSMPILLYFTNAAVHSAQGKHEQAADIAAQSIVEEIDAVEDFNKLETSLVDGSNGWEYVLGEDGNPKKAADVTGVTELKRPISINYDGADDAAPREFIARVEVDYGAYKGSFDSGATPDPAASAVPSPTPGGNTTEAKFNGYHNPHLPEVYSDKNVVISEADETESGIYAMAQQVLLKTKSDDDLKSAYSGKEIFDCVRKGVKRDFVLSIKKVDDKDCHVKGGYRFTYTMENGVNADPQYVVIKEVKVAIADLSNVYFLFKPMETDNSKREEAGAVLNFDDLKNNSGDFENFYTDGHFAVSFVRQNTSVWGPTVSSTPTPEPDDGTSTEPPAVDPAATPAATPEIINVKEMPQPSNRVKITVSPTESSGYGFVEFYASDNVEFPGAKTAKLDSTVSAQGEDDKGNLWMVRSPNDKRIAQIRVYVYAKDTYSDTATEGELAKVITTKSI